MGDIDGCGVAYVEQAAHDRGGERLRLRGLARPVNPRMRGAGAAQLAQLAQLQGAECAEHNFT